MADDAQEGIDGGGSVGDAPVKCPPCAPGLPAWMATFSDLVTLLLTFFVLLLSFAKTESAKYEAALGSIRNAFGGNVLRPGDVLQKGKSPDNSPTMLDSQEPIQPFPIDFLTTEGILEQHEINRESDEDLKDMRQDLAAEGLDEFVNVYEMPEGIKVQIKDKIYFKKGTTDPESIPTEVFSKLVKLLSKNTWVVYIQGHASLGERTSDGKNDAFYLSGQRSMEVARALIRRGVPPEKVIPVSFGDTRPNKTSAGVTIDDVTKSQRVEFLMRRRDISKEGHKVRAR